MLPSLVCDFWRLLVWPPTELPLVLLLPAEPDRVFPLDSALSVCESASDEPADEPSADPDSDPDAASPPLGLEDVPPGGEPFAPAREVDFIVLLLCACTVTLFACMLRLIRAIALSLTTEIAKLPPRPTLPPAAEAFAAIWRETAFSALTSASFLILSSVRLPEAGVPRYACTSAPDTCTASTGVAEMPPAEPALALVVSSSVFFAEISS